MNDNQAMETLQRKLLDNPALMAELHNCTDARAGAEFLSGVAAEAGVDFSVEALLDYSQERMARGGLELSDAQLDSVAGGGGTMDYSAYVALSVFTLAIGCAAVSGQEIMITGVPNNQKHLPWQCERRFQDGSEKQPPLNDDPL